MNWIGFKTLLRREIERFFVIIHQTLTPSIIVSLLYILIFGFSIGRQIPEVEGVTYTQFIIPGLIMMELIGNAYMNTSFSLYMSRRFGNFKDILTAPLSYLEMVSALTLAGVIRGFIVGIAIFVIAVFLTKIHIFSFVWLIYYALLVDFIFSSLGIIVGLASKEFEDINLLITFFLTPFTFLAGVFYSIRNLPPIFQKISLYNPILYMVDGFRYGMLGIHDANLTFGAIMVLVLAIILFALSLLLFKKGWRLRT